jgi:hypothetical protein
VFVCYKGDHCETKPASAQDGLAYNDKHDYMQK